MSTKHTKRRNKKSPDVSDASISTTNHARLRYRQRVDATAINPNQRLRELFRAGQPAPGHPAVDQGRARQAGDLIVVYRGSESNPTIVTVLRDPTISQQGQRGRSR